MKTRMNYWLMGIMVVSMICFSACKSDDDEPDPPVLERVYPMNPVSDPNISGTITFTRQDNGSTLVTIELNGTEAGNTHPAHIHANSASEGGSIVIDLGSVDGATGRGETVVTQMDNGTAITYEGMIAFNGYANVHLSSTQLSTLIAQGNIGSNSPGENGDHDHDDPGGNGDGGY